MQILTIKQSKFLKLFRNPSNRTKVNFLEKICWTYLQKNLVLRMRYHRENVRTSKFWRNRRKRSDIFFENLPSAYKDLI
jgi:hypothetical protein